DVLVLLDEVVQRLEQPDGGVLHRVEAVHPPQVRGGPAAHRGDDLGHVGHAGGGHLIDEDLGVLPGVGLQEGVADLLVLVLVGRADAPVADDVRPRVGIGGAGAEAQAEAGGGAAGEEGSPRDHLKPPIVMPRMKYRWKTKNRTSRGRITRNDAAISRLKETSCALTERNACRPIERVWTSWSCR